MPIRIDNYLKQMAKQIKNEKARENAIFEIENHLLDQIDAHIENGKEKSEAIDLILAEATNPTRLGKKLNIAHRPILLRYPVTVLTSLSIIFSILGVIIIAHYSMGELKKVYVQNKIDKDVFKKFYADLKFLEKNNIFEFSRNKNVGPYLLSHYDFYSENIEFPEDLSFLDKIIEFDHWNYFKDPIVFNHIQKAKGKDILEKIEKISSYPIPNLNRFHEMVAKRAEELILLNELERAEFLMDKSFQIIMSTHIVVGGIIASLALKRKNELIAKYKIKTWKLIDPYLQKLYRRTNYTWAGMFQGIIYNNQYKNELRPFLKKEYGACIGLTESLTAYNFNQLFFGGTYPLEPVYFISINEQKKFLNDFIKECDIPEVAFLTYETKKADFFGKENFLSYTYMGDNPLRHFRFSKIPFIRTIIGSYISVVAIPNYDRPYLESERDIFY